MNSIETKIILGIDEVGRGPWAGPLVVGAVVLGTGFQNLGDTRLDEPSQDTDPELTEKLLLYQNLADSKQLSTKKRESLAPLIYKYATVATTGWVSARELDQYGLSASLKLATRRAVKQILSQNVQFSEVIIDGTVNFLKDTPLEDRVTVLKKADGLIKEVSAASIIAKVARDQYMVELATQYPEYGFETHVGYGTAKHRDALLKHGICPEHRQSFRPIREIIAQNPTNSPEASSRGDSSAISTKPLSDRATNPKASWQPTTPRTSQKAKTEPSTRQKGQFAENLVAKYLQSHGHVIIAHNFKTKTYEIDLISTQNDKIYFTEVKYRKNNIHGSALTQITPTKQRQMHYAAEKFLSCHPEYQNLQPILAVAGVQGESPIFQAWFPLDI